MRYVLKFEGLAIWEGGLDIFPLVIIPKIPMTLVSK